VAKLGRWAAEFREMGGYDIGRWVATIGRWVAKLGSWVAKLVARLLATEAHGFKSHQTSLKNTKWAT
jgi:hypothetical protein